MSYHDAMDNLTSSRYSELGLTEITGRLPDRSVTRHAPTLAPVPMRPIATSMFPRSGKILPHEPRHTATQQCGAATNSVEISEEKSVELGKVSHKPHILDEAEKLRIQAQGVAADKAEELRIQYEVESKRLEPKPTYTIPEQQARNWIYRHGAYTFHERAQFIQYRHGYIYLRNIAAGVSMLARHLRCFDEADIEHIEQLTGLRLDHFKPDCARLWMFGKGWDAMAVEARFMDYRDGYVSLWPTGNTGPEFLYKRIEDFTKEDMRYIGKIRSRDFEMSRAMPGMVEGSGHGKEFEGDEKGEGGVGRVVEVREGIRVEVEVETREEVEDLSQMVVEVDVEAKEEAKDKGALEVQNGDNMEVEAGDKKEAKDKDSMEVGAKTYDEINSQTQIGLKAEAKMEAKEDSKDKDESRTEVQNADEMDVHVETEIDVEVKAADEDEADEDGIWPPMQAGIGIGNGELEWDRLEGMSGSEGGSEGEGWTEVEREGW